MFAEKSKDEESAATCAPKHASDAAGSAAGKRKNMIATFFPAALFCASFDIARHFDLITGDVLPASPLDLLVIPATLAVWYLAYLLFVAMDRKARLRGPRAMSKKTTAATFCGLLLVWGFYLAAFCPGFIYFDTMNSWWQFYGYVEYSNYHPVLYTALIGVLSAIPYPSDMPWTFMFFWLGVLQVVVLAAIWTWCIRWLCAHGAPRWVLVFTYLFLMANPVVPLFVILLTSDALFSAFVILMIPLIYDLVHKPLRKVSFSELASLIAVCVGVCFARNNGIYVVLFTFFCLFFWFKLARRVIFACMAGFAVFWVLVTNVIYPAAGIAEVPFAEAVGIPLQQIGCTLVEKGDVSDDEKEFLSNILTTYRLRHTWNPATADSIKYDTNFNDEFLNDNKVEFLRYWAQIGVKNPATYLKAYLMETQGWWDVGVYRWVRIGAGGWTWSDAYNVIDIDLIYNAIGIPVRQALDVVLSEEVVEWIPFANAGANIWCVALTIVFLLRTRREDGMRRNVLALTPLVGIWITLMIASPIFCEFRYVFALCMSWPFLLHFVCKPLTEGPNAT